MPRGMLGSVVTREKEAGIKFVAADGAEIGNDGRKVMQFAPVDFWEKNSVHLLRGEPKPG